MLEREAGANARLGYDIDAALGKAPVPQFVKEGIEASQKAMGEGYAPVMAEARAVNTRPIADQLDAEIVNLRGPPQKAAKEVRSWLNIEGARGTLDPSPQTLWGVRRAIDDAMKKAADTPEAVRQFENARQAVDEELARVAPGIKGVDARYAELGQQEKALAQGQKLLSIDKDTAIRPAVVARDVAEGALPQGEFIGPSAVPFRLAQGARATIDAAVGNKANDTTALKLMMQGDGDWNRAKMASLFGQRRADQALAAVDREVAFQNTMREVVGGSQTAPKQAYAKFLDEMAQGMEIPSDTTATSLALNGLKRAANSVLRRNSAAAADEAARMMGRLSVAQGGERNALVRALLKRSTEGPDRLDPKVQALITAMTQGGSQRLLGFR